MMIEQPENIGHRFIAQQPRESALVAAKALLAYSKGKTWQQLARAKESEVVEAPYCERLSAEELEKSAMSYRDVYRVNRSRSVDLSFISREKYLSRWSRENTPTDSTANYERYVRRSYTPVREISAVERVDDNRHGPRTRLRSPLAMVTAPYHTNVHYRSEQEPFRKYDVFGGLRTWSYPIYKYVYGSQQDYRRPYSYRSFERQYGTTSSYTPPQMTAESSRITTRRGYSGYNYMATETNFDIASQPKSLKNYMYSRNYLGTANAPSYWSYYGNSSLRHFNSYRPHNYTASTASWSRYY
ncbi:unnamed protein product [Auanema sp. JU1783]|nr:unnamed protein product [Auanema sp. JU1783]